MFCRTMNKNLRYTRLLPLLPLLLAISCSGLAGGLSRPAAAAANESAALPADTSATAQEGTISSAPRVTFGSGDAVNLQVYGRPELSTSAYVAEDGTIQIPLLGRMHIAGMSPDQAGRAIAEAFRSNKFLLNPQVTVTPTQFRGPQVSVLGAVRTPGRFVIESGTTVLDVLAQAGGATENGSDVVVLLRPDRDGKISRYPIDLKGLSHDNMPLPTLTLRGGDSLYVPPAEQFYINGEVHAPNMYRLEPGMTVAQAISRGGGVTPRGSSSRIEIRRRKPDGTYVTRDGELGDAVQANDVIRVKERIF